jgi:hypothetical protein
MHSLTVIYCLEEPSAFQVETGQQIHWYAASFAERLLAFKHWKSCEVRSQPPLCATVKPEYH